MGAYLDKPVTDIAEGAGEGYYFEYASASMQGWRVKQEDAHSCLPLFDPEKEMSLFAVFDGHGGPEVSRYCSENLPDHIKADDYYKKGVYEEALRSSFISFDNLLKEDETAKSRLWELSERCGEESPAEEDPEDFNNLLEEASMPLEAVMAKYVLSRATGEGSSKSGALVWDEGTDAAKSETSAVNGLPGSPAIKVSNGEIGTVMEDTVGMKTTGDGDAPVKAKDAGDETITRAGDSAEKPINTGDGTVTGEGDAPVKPKDTGDETITRGGDSEDKPTDTGDGTSTGKGDSEEKPADTGDGTNTSEGDSEEKPTDTGDGTITGKGDAPVKPKDTGDETITREGDSKDKPTDTGDGTITSEGESAGKPKNFGDGTISCGEDTPKKSKGSGDGDQKSSGDSVDQPSSTPKIGKSSGKSTGSSSGKSPLKKRQSGRLMVKPPRNFPANYDDDTSSSESDSSEQEEEEEEAGGLSGDWEDMTTSSEATSEDDEDDELPEYLKESNEEEEPGVDSGTTAVVALLTKTRIIVANVGDSRAILGRLHPAEGDKPAHLEAVDLSFDHKPELPEEKLRVMQAGGYVDKDGRVDGGLNLSRALGDHVFKKRDDLAPEQQRISPMPDIHVEALKLPHDLSSPGDQFLFIACDGIWNELSSQEAADFIWTRMCKLMDLNTICREMFQHCLSPDTRGDGTGCDNMTAVLLRLYKPPEDEATNTSNKREAVDELEESPTKKTKM